MFMWTIELYSLEKVSLSKLTLELAFEGKSTILSPLADQTTSRIIAELGKNVNVRSSTWEEVHH